MLTVHTVARGVCCKSNQCALYVRVLHALPRMLAIDAFLYGRSTDLCIVFQTLQMRITGIMNKKSYFLISGKHHRLCGTRADALRLPMHSMHIRSAVKVAIAKRSMH